MQHNYVYESPRKLPKEQEYLQKIDRIRNNSIDLQSLAISNPTAYNNYVSNLEKMNENNDKMEKYANYIREQKERLAKKQADLNSINQLNGLNVYQKNLFNMH